MTVLELKAKRAAQRHYIQAADRLAERAMRAFGERRTDTARAFALFANDVRRWGKAEVCE